MASVDPNIFHVSNKSLYSTGSGSFTVDVSKKRRRKKQQLFLNKQKQLNKITNKSIKCICGVKQFSSCQSQRSVRNLGCQVSEDKSIRTMRSVKKKKGFWINQSPVVFAVPEGKWW